MTSIPGAIPVDHFTLSFRGSFGRFRTQSSHALHYLQTTLRTKDLSRLSTASETFDIRDIDFEERTFEAFRIVPPEALSAGFGNAEKYNCDWYTIIRER